MRLYFAIHSSVALIVEPEEGRRSVSRKEGKGKEREGRAREGKAREERMDVLCLRLIGLLLLSSVLTFFSFLVFVRHSILPGLTSGSRPSQRHHTEL
jgi:hypothetical protein